jgi:hypothetical protein
MSNITKGSAIEARRMARRKDEIARDLEVLVQRLAESREAIVGLLAAAAGDGQVVALEPPRNPVTPLRAVRGTLGKPEAETEPEPDELPGPAARALAAPTNGLGQDGQAWERFVNAGEALGMADADARGTRAARRMVLAAVLLAVGAVVLLTTLVSLL